MRVATSLLASVAFLFALVGLGGCGDTAKVGTITVSPEAKKADDNVQKNMMEYMQTKGAKKAKTKS